MLFRTSVFICVVLVVFSSDILYGAVAEIGGEVDQIRGGVSRAPGCDLEGECPAAVEISMFRGRLPDEERENSDEQSMFGNGFSAGESVESKGRDNWRVNER